MLKQEISNQLQTTARQIEQMSNLRLKAPTRRAKKEDGKERGVPEYDDCVLKRFSLVSLK